MREQHKHEAIQNKGQSNGLWKYENIKSFPTRAIKDHDCTKYGFALLL